jgi:hypothetical protein
LARDANTASNPVATENYLQHAEHYFRLIAAAQTEQLPAQVSDVRVTGHSAPEDLDDSDDFGALPDRFASPGGKRGKPSPTKPTRLRRLLISPGAVNKRRHFPSLFSFNFFSMLPPTMRIRAKG